MERCMIVCGYGKRWTNAIYNYIEFSLLVAIKYMVSAIIYSGGDTTDDRNGSWKTEAGMMETIANTMKIDRVKFQKEGKAYNTLTNILFSLEMFKRDISEADKIFIVCNTAHMIKVFFAAVKIFGLTATKRRIVICPFPLTRRVGENVKTFLKTPIEVFGYFFRPFGRYLEYWQWWLRTGRNERIGYWQFRIKCLRSGELI